MSVNEIMQEIRDGLSGEYGVDMAYLEGQVSKYKDHENAADIESQIAELAYEILPDEKKEQVARMMYLDGKRLDAVMNEAIKLINEKKHGFLRTSHN